MRPSLFAAALALVGSSLIACNDGTEADEADDYEIVPEGKEDSFRSPTTAEFTAKADATVTLPESARALPEAERLAQAQELVSAKLLQIGWFLNLYVADKEPEDANKTYGGFHAMARNSSVKSLGITAVDAVTYKFNFEATIAAQNKFLSLLPGTTGANGRPIELAMGKLTNAELLAGGWTSRFDVHAWNPATVDAATVETQPMVIAQATRSANAYLDYGKLYADGKLLVGAQFGWDYNAGRSDLANAEQMYDELVQIGFHSPVDGFAKLTLDSEPLTRAGLFNGKVVEISVKLVHPGMVASPSADALKLRTALLDLLKTKEVVLFNGHAGVSGRLLPADFRSTSAGNILPTEYPTLPLYDGYQVLLIEGCQTYARFTDGFRANPAKRGPSGELVNMDIVTSTSYTWTSQGAESMEAILWPLVGTSATKNIKPVTWDDILVVMNSAPNETAFMGVNGIDNDPHAHPYGRSDKLGASCTSSTACGGTGNLCMKQANTTAKVCGSVCIDDAGCPSTYKCSKVAASGTISTNACVKR
ncbi:MAG: hypothetical protein NT062_31435 [Proteobacteria bacterium]|nr:hypothetical protein [Pseudomonadota bacterium]